MLSAYEMTSVRCPYCGGNVRFAPRLFGLPYCTTCGWKLKEAEKSSRQFALVALIIAFLGLIFFYRTIVLDWPLPVRGLYLIFWTIFPALLGFLSWLDYQRIVVAEPQTVTPKTDEWAALAASEYEPILRLSTPRIACIAWKGWLRVCIGFVCIGPILYLVIAEPFGAGNLAIIGMLLIVVAWANLNLVQQHWSHVRLLESGNVVIGRVVQQRFQNVRLGTDMIGRYSLIEYEFHTREGLLVSGGGHDYSKSHFQDMPVLVFYAADDPLRNVALGCSLYAVRVVPEATYRASA